MPSSNLLRQVSDWLADARARHLDTLSTDGSGVMIYGDVGGAAYIRADGSIFLQAWQDVPDNHSRADPGFLHSALVSAAKNRPILAELLPSRPSGPVDCDACKASGWITIGATELVCSRCHGLGWRSAA